MAKKLLRWFGLGSLALFLLCFCFFPTGLLNLHKIRSGEPFHFDFREQEDNQIALRNLPKNSAITIQLDERVIALPNLDELNEFSYYQLPQEGSTPIPRDDEWLSNDETNVYKGTLYRAHDFLIIKVSKQALEEYGFQEMTISAPEEVEIQLTVYADKTAFMHLYSQLFHRFDPHE